MDEHTKVTVVAAIVLAVGGVSIALLVLGFVFGNWWSVWGGIAIGLVGAGLFWHANMSSP